MAELHEYADFLHERRERIVELIGAACARAGRDADEVAAIAVSKTVGADEVRLAHDAGWSRFGENRPQELVRKSEALVDLIEAGAIRFDMIGNLQKNKINQVLGRAALVHSISSAHLAEGVSARAEARGIAQPVLIEANVSGEASKSGFSPDELRACAESLAALPGIAIEGLMTMAPAHDADAARATFSGLRELGEELRARTGLALATLSFGMSDDFEIAVEEGSTCLRLGRVVFDRGYELV